ncbi:ABC transporter ATP-binding protein [Aureimonas mangrovi]|uniref:ABC transporter ATP-binding protein n=1 Tax=Aureimonas mangrovi TaxID=2758041 RepID=UPI00163DACCB|nr:ABC transporter ATP-binding protein [Aureimonas mangrovi]
MTPCLDISAVRCSFGDFTAIADISLRLAEGEIAALVGHSGCGKSTLLRIIAGVETPNAGSIRLDGRMIVGDGIFVEPERRNVGFMFQDYALFPHLTARQNIAFGLRGLGRRAAAERVEAIVERIGIGRLAERHPHELSGGEQQRVALARALAPQPRVLLMDEPFSNLDRGLRDTVRRETMALLRALGTTAIIVTHDPEEALALADKVALMKAGRIVEAGTRDEIYGAPRTAYAAAFFSQVNRVPATRSGGWLESPLGRFPATGGEDGPVQLLIRPSAIALGETGVPARVVDRVLLGEIEETLLAVDGIEAPIVARSSVRTALGKGQTTRIAVAPRDVMAFSAGEADGLSG